MTIVSCSPNDSTTGDPDSGAGAGNGPVESRTVSGAGGVSVAYDVQGSGDTTLIFVHGWLCDGSYWREQVPVFASDYRVAVVDLGGHGRSTANRDDWSMQSFGADVAAVADDLGADQIVLVGHSMGGAVVLDAAQRLGDRVKGLVSVDSSRDLTTGPLSLDAARTQFALTAENFSERVAYVVKEFLFDESSPPELVTSISADMAAGSYEVGSEAGPQLSAYDVAANLADIEDVPVTVINADYRPTNAASFHTVHPNTTVVVVPDVSHFLMVENPTSFNAALSDALERFGLD